MGDFTCQLTDLERNATYYVRAYATNSIGTKYGEQLSFTTLSGLASVVTANATNVTETSAILGGEVTDDGGYAVTQRGVCYATHQEPNFADNVAVMGSGNGSFSREVQNLTPLAVYYCRAFAINAIDTVFGEQNSFTAVNGMPSVTTSQVTNILPTSATAGGVVTDDGGHNVTERGVCWSTEHHPDLDDNHAQNGTGVGSFTVQMTGLAPSTRYYVRAYAKNSEGTSFGNEESFTTPGISVPTVSTQSVTNITRTTALGGGVVSSDGGAAVIERGICWSSSPNPAISGSHVASGVGEGSYSVQMIGLTPNTTYYVKAYAINSQGEGYGEEKTFRTENTSSPLVTTSQVTNITQTTATGGGNVTDEGGGTVTERGIFCSANSLRLKVSILPNQQFSSSVKGQSFPSVRQVYISVNNNILHDGQRLLACAAAISDSISSSVIPALPLLTASALRAYKASNPLAEIRGFSLISKGTPFSETDFFRKMRKARI